MSSIKKICFVCAYTGCDIVENCVACSENRDYLESYESYLERLSFAIDAYQFYFGVSPTIDNIVSPIFCDISKGKAY